MKSIYVMFEDKEFEEVIKKKCKFLLNWHDFILKLVKDVMVQKVI